MELLSKYYLILFFVLVDEKGITPLRYHAGAEKAFHRSAFFIRPFDPLFVISNIIFCFGGRKGDRTLGLRVANAALSQLSYSPV
jgi:hypothetical protein